MVLLPGYRWVKIGEIIPHDPCLRSYVGDRLVQSSAAGSECVVHETYMVPVAKPSRVRSYMPTETSLQAHESQKDKAPNDGARILGCIAASTVTGCTCDEVETLLQFSHQTASARIRDLSKGGLLVDSGLRRKTRTGRSATVWKASK